MPGFYDTLEQNIAKYGGEDEAYKLKLKSSIREALGYSNYQSQALSAMKKPLDLSSMKGNITPAGVKSLVGGAINMQEQEAGTYQNMANKVDTAANQLATDRIAKERAAAAEARNKMGLENGITFTPENDLETKILNYMQQPHNNMDQAGIMSPKSMQQFEAELNAEGKYSPEEVKAALMKRLPQDYWQNQDKYMMMSQGFSKKQAEENAGALKYEAGLMSEPEKLIYETQNPEMAKALTTERNLGKVIRDVTTTEVVKDEDTGKETTVPKYTYKQLEEMYPDVTPATLKQVTAPVYKKAAVDDIETSLNESSGIKKPKEWMGMDWIAPDTEEINNMDVLKSVYNKEDTSSETLAKGGITAVKSTAIYNELKNKLEEEYYGILSSTDVENLLYNSIMARI
jgi:hypothetical protein